MITDDTYSGSRRSVSSERKVPDSESDSDGIVLHQATEDVALRRRQHSHPTNGTLHTFFNFMNSNLGTGVLALPDAIKKAGLVFGSFGIVFIGMLSTFCCHLLLKAYRRVSSDRPMSYDQVTEVVFQRASSHHPNLPNLARSAKQFVNAVTVISQLGFCAVYIKFCAHVLQGVTEDYYQYQARSIQFYETVIVLLLLPYCCITTLRNLVAFAFVANILSAICLLTVLHHLYDNMKPIDSVLWFPSNFGNVPLFFGTAMFTFESIALILPIENAMKDRHRFHGWNGLLSISMGVVITLYVFMGSLGYLAFGQKAQMILSNLPSTSGLYSCVKIFYGISVMISYNFQLYVPVQILYPSLQSMDDPIWNGRSGELKFRFLLVLFTYICSIYVPCLELLISLFGAFSSSWLALILPPIVGYLSEPAPSRVTFKLLRNLAICLFGLFGCVMGTYVSLVSIFKAFRHPEICAA